MVVERLANRRDAAVHHVARGHDVGAGLGVAHRGAGQQLEAAVVVHVAVHHHPAVAVRRVFAEADVRQQDEVGEARPQRAQRLLNDPVVLPRTGCLLVLLRRDAEEQDGADARRCEVLDYANEAAEVEARHARQLLVRERLGSDEERHDELVEREPGLAHEPAQGSRTAEAPQPGDRERAHARMVRRSLGFEGP